MKHLLYILCLFVLSCDSGGTPTVHGCLDSGACNYNSNANTDNSSCEYCFEDDCDTYSEENYACDGSCLVEVDCEGECGGDAVVVECGVWDGDTINQCGSGDYVHLWGVCYNIEETVELNLSSNGLIGEIPPEIGYLTNLTSLDLYDNQLTGEIPPEIGYLTNLTFLSSGDNQLTGEIPLEIGQLTNLSDLGLLNNQFTGEIPYEIGNLPNLTDLLLLGNQLTGEIPSNICNVSSLFVSNNQLCPPYPSCISQYDIDSQDTSNCPEE